MASTASTARSTLIVLPRKSHIHELQTILRNVHTSRSHFKFSADRLIRLVVEEGLNCLSYTPHVVTTPTGCRYEGLAYQKGVCGVSVIRSGEAMEQGLRDCCRSIRIGKILVSSDTDTSDAKVVYAKLPEDVERRKVLLMYPIMQTGNTVCKALHVLREHGVRDTNIIVLTLFCTPAAIESIRANFASVVVLTSEIDMVTPSHFGQAYFGTD